MGRYSDLARPVERLRKALVPGAAMDEVTEAIIALTHVSRALEAGDAKRVFTTLIPTMAPSARRGELRFAMEGLQKAYEAEVRGKMRFTDEIHWLLTSRSQLVAEIRRMLTGIDLEALRHVLHVVGDRVLRADNVIHSEYFPRIVGAFDEVVKGEEGAARLARSLAPMRETILRFQKTGTIADLSFWRIKGEVTEALTLPVKQAYLQEYPGATLIEGVMAMTQLTREGVVTAARTPRQIWDGIIAEVTPRGLQIHVKFEVKSGLQGFREGWEQILSTHYHRFGSFGDQLIVPLADGTQRTFRTSAKPGSRESISQVASSNVLLAPKGNSSKLPNQLVQFDDTQVTLRLLELNGVELTHFDVEALVMHLLRGWK